MVKLIASLTFQSEYFSEEVLKEKKGMTLPKQIKVELVSKTFITPIGGGTPFGTVFFEVTHFDLEDGSVEDERAYSLKDLMKTIRAMQKFYGYTDKFTEDLVDDLAKDLHKAKNSVYNLYKKGVYSGLEDLNKKDSESELK